MKMISRKTEKRIELFLSPMEAMDIVILRRVLRRAVNETEGLKGIDLSILRYYPSHQGWKSGDRCICLKASGR